MGGNPNADFRSHPFHDLVIVTTRRGGGGATVRPFLTEPTTMIFIGILFSIAVIGFFCWLLFTLAVFALPLFAGATAATWAHHTGAGVLGAVLTGLATAGLTLAIGQTLLALVRPLWLRIPIMLAFVAPAAAAGFFATHGIVKHTMPSETWQVAFSIVGAVAVGFTALIRINAIAPPEPAGQGLSSI